MIEAGPETQSDLINACEAIRMLLLPLLTAPRNVHDKEEEKPQNSSATTTDSITKQSEIEVPPAQNNVGLISAILEKNDQEKASLQQKFDQILRAVSDELEQKKRECQEKDAKLQSLSDSLLQLQQAKVKLEDENDTLKKENASMKEKIESQEFETRSVLPQKFSRLEAEISRLEGIIHDYQADAKDLEEYHQRLEATFVCLQGVIEQKEQEIHAVTKRSEILLAQLQDKQLELCKHKAQIESDAETIVGLKDSLQSLELANKNLNTALRENQELLKTTIDTASASQHKIDALLQDCSKIRLQYQEELRNAQEKQAVAQATVSQLEHKLGEYEDELRSKTATIEERESFFNHELQKRDKAIEDLSEAVSQGNERFNMCKEELIVTMEKVAHLKKHLSEIKESAEDKLYKETSLLTQKIRQLEVELNSFTQTKNKELEALQSKNVELEVLLEAEQQERAAVQARCSELEKASKSRPTSESSSGNGNNSKPPTSTSISNTNVRKAPLPMLPTLVPKILQQSPQQNQQQQSSSPQQQTPTVPANSCNICKKPASGLMVSCSDCGKRFHANCTSSASFSSNFVCDECKDAANAQAKKRKRLNKN